MDQTLSSYRVFYEVAKAGNISKAAKQLYISQPAISKSIVKLEEQVGVQLFYRNSRGVQLTAEGEILFSHVQDAFRYLKHGEAELARIRQFNIGHLRIGASASLCKFILIPYLKEFLKKHPHMKVTIENPETRETVRKIEGRQLDVGTVVQVPMKHGTHFLKIMDIQDIFVCTPDYLKRFYEMEGREANVLENGTLILLDRENVTRHYIDDYLKNQGVMPRKVLEISTMDLQIEFAKIGLGVAAVVREFVLKELRDGTLIELPLPDPLPKRQVGFVYQESNQNEALRSFLQSAR